MVIKSAFEEDMLVDIQETFDILRFINMKLSPKKSSFSVEEGLFLGHLITKQGIKATPLKVKENKENDEIGSKPDKNGKRGEAGRSQKQLQLKEEEKPKKKKEWPKMHARIKNANANHVIPSNEGTSQPQQPRGENEVNELIAKRLARTTNPLALAAQQQLVYHPQPHPTHHTQNFSTRSQATTRSRGKAIVNPHQPTYDLEPELVANADASSKENEIDRLMSLILMSFKKIYKPTNNNLITSSNTMNLNVDSTPRSSRGTGYDRQTGQYDNQRVVNVDRAIENVGTQVV
nr:reverse transcriptase domain-containing protein [Tanacetum cinerariifolium]